MSLQTRKNNLIQYIFSHLSEDEFNGGSSDDALGFPNYDEFLQAQQNFINGYNEQSIQTLEFLRDSIIPNINVMDKESMIDFNASGFALNDSGRIVVFNER